MTTMQETAAPASTGLRGGEQDDYTWSPSIQAGWIHRETAQLVDRVGLIQDDIEDLHNGAKEADLSARTASKARKSVRGLLTELGADRGMSWSDIAAWAGVSVSAVRKWRQGGDSTPENRARLASIAALLDWLTEYLIDDPVQWLEMDFPLGAGYSVRPLDLLLDGHVSALLDIAAQRTTPQQVLDQLDPDWRENLRSDHEVFRAPDGLRAIRRRGT